ncbi:MAG: hypothetical protein P4L50_03135 [Anaerolineaceae bacterium]|nr:hypothetical protein [Anaerolineaceae bacterium]
MNQLFCDGGVVGKNPSEIGGTWAFRLLTDGIVTCEKSGHITPEDAQMPVVTNNLTEMIALIKGLQNTPTDWIGTVCSDSQVTLGRVFQGWKWNGIPLWMHKQFQQIVKEHTNWDKIDYVRLDGHPTKEQLKSGIGKRGGPVSIHNQWCDKACGKQAELLYIPF